MGFFHAAVLVGGQSRRMGLDKAVLEVDGTPLAGRLISTLRTAGAVEIVTVGGADRGLGVRHVPDRYPGEGPLGGLISALSALGPAVGQPHAGTPCELAMVVACDLPELAPGTVSRLVEAAEGVDVVFARTGRREPLCAVWRCQVALPLLERAFESGERAIHRALGGLRVGEVAVDAGELVNLNTPEDLRTLRNGAPPPPGN